MRWKAAARLSLVASLFCAGLAAAADKVPAKPVARPTAKVAPKPAAAVPAPPAAAASAPAPATAVPEGAVTELNRVFKNSVTPRFAVRADDRLDPDMRAAAEAMQAQHLPRVRALMDRWMLEELQQPDPSRAFKRMLARLSNEFAIWGRDSTGPAQDAALAQALQMPGMCRPVGAYASELVLRLGRLRGLPPEVRQQAVQAERELLARWGQPRQVSDADPLAAEETLLQLRATGQAPKKPLPPLLAYYYLGEVDDNRRDPLLMESTTRCALHHWAGADPAQFRAAMAMDAADVAMLKRSDAGRPMADDNPYPSLASYFGVQGVVTLDGEVNADGRLVRPRIGKRDLSVPGIRDARPFAFEGALDLATLAKAGGMDWSVWAPKQGVKKVRREFDWSLK